MTSMSEILKYILKINPEEVLNLDNLMKAVSLAAIVCLSARQQTCSSNNNNVFFPFLEVFTEIYLY